MGYCIYLRDSKFNISAKNVPKALVAVKKLGIHNCFSWVNADDFLAAKDFKEAMKVWRWPVVIDSSGAVTIIGFNGEKLGDDQTLFDAIAPYVKSGSYIEVQGEDGEFWKWCFNGKRCVHKSGRVVYS